MFSSVRLWLKQPHPFIFPFLVLILMSFLAFHMSVPVEPGRELGHLCGMALTSFVAAFLLETFYAVSAHLGLLLRSGWSMQAIKVADRNLLMDLEDARLGYGDAFADALRGAPRIFRLFF